MNVQSATAITNYYQQSSSSSAVSVAQALSAIKLNPRAKLTLSDSAANIENNLANLAAIANNLNSVTLTDDEPGFITLTAKQLLSKSVAALTNKMNLGGAEKISLRVTDALAKDIALLQPATAAKIGQFSLKDTSVNIASKFDSIGVFEAKLGDIQLTDPTKFLKLTHTQYSTNSGLLEHLVGTYGLEVSGATTAQALDMAEDTKVAKINIVDAAQNIADNLDALETLGLKVKTIKSDDTNLFKISAEQLKNDSAVIGKIYKGYQLAVFNIDSSTALSVKSNKKIVTLDIVDSAAGISKNLALLRKLGDQLHSIQINDNQPLSMKAVDYFNNEAILKKIVKDPSSNTAKTDGPIDPVTDTASADFNNIYQLAILESSAVDAQTIKDNSRVASISVKDTSAAISINLSDLNNNDLINDIAVVGTNNAINITFDQLASNADAISLLKSNNGTIKFNVRGVAAGDAKALINDASKRVATISVSDTAANLAAKLSDLTSIGKNLTTIVQTDARIPGLQGNALSLTANDWMLHIGSLSKILGGYSVNLKDVGAAKALSLANDVRVKSFEVLDTGASISTNFDTLQSLGSKLTLVKQSDGAAIEITGRQYSAPGNILTKLEDTYKLSVKNAQANQISAMVQDISHISSVQVLDTVDNIASHFVALQEAATLDELTSKLSVSVAGIPKPFTLSKTDLETYADALNVIEGNYKVHVTGVAAASAKSFAENTSHPIHSHLQSMEVTASSANLSNKLLVEELNALGNKISKVSQSDFGTLIPISQQNWEANSNVFSKVLGYQVSLSDVSASGATTLLQNEHVAQVQVKDTASQLSINFGNLMALGPALTAITQSDAAVANSHLQISMAQWKTGTDTLAKIQGNYKADLSDASASDAASVATNTKVDTVSVKDSAFEISAKFNQLVANSKLSEIVLTGPVAPINISQTQLVAGSSLLDKVQGGYTLAVTNADVSASADLLANEHVISAEMTGTAAAITESLSELSQFGTKLKSLTLTGANPSISLSFTDFQKYQNVLGLIDQNFKLELTEIKASDAIVQDSNGQFNFSFSVNDSADQIASNISGLSALSTKLTGITTVEDEPVLTMKASEYLANRDVLAKINTTAEVPYQLALTGGDISFARNVLADSTQSETISSLALVDSAETISQSFAVISNDKVLSARLRTTPGTLTLSGEDYADTATLAKIKGTFDISVDAANVEQSTALEADSRVISYSLTSTTTEVGDSLPDLLDLSKLDHINITQDDTAMSLTMADYILVEDKLNKLVGNFGLRVSEAEVTDLDTLANKNEVSSIQISDVSANVSASWDQLLALGDKLNSIEITNDQVPVAITFDQYAISATTIAKLVPANQALALLDVPPDQATVASGEENVATVSVKGLASQVATNFESLIALGSKIDAIEISDGNTLVLTQDQFDADIGGATLDKFTGVFNLEVLE